jgi:hypothetical protein
MLRFGSATLEGLRLNRFHCRPVSVPQPMKGNPHEGALPQPTALAVHVSSTAHALAGKIALDRASTSRSR